MTENLYFLLIILDKYDRTITMKSKGKFKENPKRAQIEPPSKPLSQKTNSSAVFTAEQEDTYYL